MAHGVSRTVRYMMPLSLWVTYRDKRLTGQGVVHPASGVTGPRCCPAVRDSSSALLLSPDVTPSRVPSLRYIRSPPTQPHSTGSPSPQRVPRVPRSRHLPRTP